MYIEVEKAYHVTETTETFCGFAEKFAIQQLENLQPNIKSIIQLDGSPSHWGHFCHGCLEENCPQISWRAEHTLDIVVTK